MALVSLESHENGPFHTALLERFAPIVENYLNVMETSITTSLVAGIEREKWIPMSENSHHYSKLDRGAAGCQNQLWPPDRSWELYLKASRA